MTDPHPQSEARDPDWIDKAFALVLYLLPHHLLSGLMHWLTRIEWRPVKNWMIGAVTRIYDVALEEAVHQSPEDYACFNDFFTRQLNPDARPLCEVADALISPVDGKVSQVGQIDGGRIFQAKGQSYDLSELLGGDQEWRERFEGGSFATLYLSPRDYHRIHMPLGGSLQRMLHVPGRLFSVSPSTTRVVPRLFSRNERLVNLFETEAGPMAVIMVGAIFVASMETVWAGTQTPVSRRITPWDYGEAQRQPVSLEKGEEMGRFNMGSTVILLFAEDALAWDDRLKPGHAIKMGEQLGSLKADGH